MTIHRVIIFISHPSAGDPGQASEGYYVIEDGELIMTHSDGEPVSPDQFRHRLKAGDDANAIAGILTVQVRRLMLGITKADEAFGRPLNYGNSGIA
jgi:hypothetical protein